uniref:Protein translocase subunit SecD n=1 Tax=uncultured marine bacterium HF10_05C07 TaxID=415443 RepID=A4GJJ1_9BACT|nr:protein-export membrane protein SecD [uncultured marine bacterium HF10_05C07]
MVLTIGIIFSLPNIFPPDPSVQITTSSVGDGFSERFVEDLENKTRITDIQNLVFEKNDKSILIRTKSYQDQIKLKDFLQKELDENFVVALNLAANTPNWLKSLNAKPMKLGLDLRGGVNFLMEVDTDLLIETKLESTASVLRNSLRDARIKVNSINVERNKIVLNLSDEEKLENFNKIVSDIGILDVSFSQNLNYELSFSDQEIEDTIEYAVLQNLTTLRNRVNELGVSEPVVQREGEKRISVQLPGIQDTAEAKKIIGKTANLEFRLEAKNNSLASRVETFPYRGLNTKLEKKIIISGDRVSDASVGFDENGFPQVNISLDSDGGAQMHRATRNNVGVRMAVLFVEKKIRSLNDNGATSIKNYYDKRIISLATIQSALANQFRITGLDSPAEASELALLLRAGALAAPMNFVEEGTIGPSLGADNIRLGINSLILGLSLVLIFMVFYYKGFGLIANLAVLLNLVLIASVMSILSATLTLPGIAGIVLTIGMAVDANVLIFSRIREELQRNLKPLEAITSGYDRAFITIVDANLTTLIVALILYIVGTGPIQGFAITLSVGILTSMFTAILFTRMLVFFVYGRRRNVEKIWI